MQVATCHAVDIELMMSELGVQSTHEDAHDDHGHDDDDDDHGGHGHEHSRRRRRRQAQQSEQASTVDNSTVWSLSSLCLTYSLNVACTTLCIS